jgi:hypothetical protein
MHRVPQPVDQSRAIVSPVAVAASPATVPSIGFAWKSDPIDKCPPAEFAVRGNELNGKYYDEAK